MRLRIIATFIFILSLTGAAFATTTDSSDATAPIIKPPAKPAAGATTPAVKPPAKPAATSKTTPAKPAAKSTTATTKKATSSKTTTAKAAKPTKKSTVSNVNKPAKKKVAAKPKEPYVVITINKATQKMTVTVGGRRTYNWLVSTGAQGYTTPSGSFRPFRMEAEHFSKEWDDAPMPHSIFFTGEGHAIHGSPYTKRLGTRASHGCVRLSPQNAATLFELVKKTGMSNTRVIVRGGGFDWWTSSIDTSDIQPSRWIRKVDPLEELDRMFND